MSYLQLILPVIAKLSDKSLKEVYFLANRLLSDEEVKNVQQVIDQLSAEEREMIIQMVADGGGKVPAIKHLRIMWDRKDEYLSLTVAKKVVETMESEEIGHDGGIRPAVKLPTDQ